MESTEAEGKALFDRATQRALGISGAEFLTCWDGGAFVDSCDPDVHGLVLLIPFAR